MPDETKQPDAEAHKEVRPLPGPPDLSKVDMAELWDEDDYLARTGQQPPLPGEEDKFYELDGRPIRFGNNPSGFPERWNEQTKQWEPFHSMTRIAFEATRLTEKEYKDLLASVGAE